jgi:hypothetical protein
MLHGLEESWEYQVRSFGVAIDITPVSLITYVCV